MRNLDDLLERSASYGGGCLRLGDDGLVLSTRDLTQFLCCRYGTAPDTLSGSALTPRAGWRGASRRNSFGHRSRETARPFQKRYRLIGSPEVVHARIAVSGSPVHPWIVANARLGPELTRAIEPVGLLAESQNCCMPMQTASDFGFLLQQKL